MNVYCNNERCRYNQDQICTSERVFYIDRLCVTFRSQGIKDIMDAPFQPNCRRAARKYRSTGSGRILK